MGVTDDNVKIDLSIISRINDSVDLSDADKKTLMTLVLVKSKGSVDVDKVKAQARKEAIEEYKKEHREFINRIKHDLVVDIISMIYAEEGSSSEDFVHDHLINANSLIKRIREKYPDK